MLMTDFLKEVDKLSASMKKDQLIGFIHNEARILSEDKREEFLARLSDFAIPSGSKAKKDNEIEQLPDEVFRQLNSIYEELDSVNGGEVSLIGEWNEAYDDWYDDEEPYIYRDPEKITEKISSACMVLHTLIDWEKYDEALKLAKALLELNISTITDEDDSVFSFSDLFEHDLISVDFEKTILDMLYAAYMAQPLQERPETLFRFMELSEWDDVNLEKVMQHSNRELPQIPEFLDCWIEVLCGKSGDLTEYLLREAVTMIADTDKLARYAEKYCVNHPCIYDALLRTNRFSSAKEAIQIGIKALKSVPAYYVVRSNIAIITAEYALAMDDIKSAEYCWLEAFRSNPTPTNLLRLMTLYRDFSEIESEVRKIISPDINEARQHSSYDFNSAKEIRPYHVSQEDKYRLLFLLGDYMYVFDNGMKRKTSLGWSGTFLKCGIPLFFLLMYNKTRLETATIEMRKVASGYMSFQAEEYCRGTQVNKSGSNEVLFWDLFKQIKRPDKLSGSEQKKILERLADLTEIRTTLIVSGQKRGYYSECAAYIAALGEVLESRGEKDEKQRLLLEYKNKYPRHSAFIRELKTYGLK